MEADVIKTRVVLSWQDASAHWKDEYASRYNKAVIVELENTLDRIRSASAQLSDDIYAALAELNEFYD